MRLLVIRRDNMTIEEQTKIEDNISVLDRNLIPNKDYDRQYFYYKRKIEQEEFTKELLKEE